MSEVFLRQIILEELEYEPILDASHIGVAVEKGIVTLTGQCRKLGTEAGDDHRCATNSWRSSDRRRD
jgi:osmotically-inducible protein OsmY